MLKAEELLDSSLGKIFCAMTQQKKLFPHLLSVIVNIKLVSGKLQNNNYLEVNMPLLIVFQSNEMFMKLNDFMFALWPRGQGTEYNPITIRADEI